jgi:alkanesulfonate monooxygenase SsuD/methylene tetrahydromethanopterin reductase-like flavin-dependent oxidoreductase (luciferase family)
VRPGAPEDRPARLRVGVALPTFRDDELALTVASEAEAAGVDGVFVYDHLWPMGRPDRPALAAFPVLGALAARTERLVLGPLVARVGMVPGPVLEGRFAALVDLAPGRVVAGLGTGDAKSAAEHRAYGVPARSATQRRRSLATLGARLADRGLPVWVGAGASATVELARRAGFTVNLWAAPPAAVADAARAGPVTWGGSLRPGSRAQRRQLAELARAGARWVVATWPVDLAGLVDAAARLAD